MTEDLLVQMSDSEKLNWLVRTVGLIDERSHKVEQLVARDTNPLPDNYNVRFAALENDLTEARKELRLMNRKFEVFAQDFMKTRVDVRDVEERLAALESRPN